MPIKAKTPQEILNELSNMPFSVPIGEGSFQGLWCPSCRNERFSCKGCLEPWLRSSMQSLLLYVMGEMPKGKEEKYRGWSESRAPDQAFRDGQTSGYNIAITDCLAVIQSTIDSIKE